MKVLQQSFFFCCFIHRFLRLNPRTKNNNSTSWLFPLETLSWSCCSSFLINSISHQKGTSANPFWGQLMCFLFSAFCNAPVVYNLARSSAFLASNSSCAIMPQSLSSDNFLIVSNTSSLDASADVGFFLLKKPEILSIVYGMHIIAFFGFLLSFRPIFPDIYSICFVEFHLFRLYSGIIPAQKVAPLARLHPLQLPGQIKPPKGEKL